MLLRFILHTQVVFVPEMFRTFRKRGFEMFEPVKGASNFQVQVFGHVFVVSIEQFLQNHSI